MKTEYLKHLRLPLLIMVVFLLLVGCSKASPSPLDTAYDTSVTPDKEQPEFPKLGTTWIIDNGCNFTEETVAYADEILEQLRADGIAEIAVVCQTGVQDRGPTNDHLIWLLEWARWARLGDIEDQRAAVWLIRPDVDPSQGRVAVQVSRWLTWWTAIDYGPTLEEAGNYANWNNLSGALESIVNGTNQSLRTIWNEREHR